MSVALATQCAPVTLSCQKILQYLLYGLWTCCGHCGVISYSDLAVLQLVHKVHNCPQSPQPQASCGDNPLHLLLQE